MLEKCVLTLLELNWNQRLGQKKTKLNICHHMLTSSTQLQNRSFHVAERTRTSSKCQDEKCTCKACKNAVYLCQICKFMGFLLPSSSWLLKLPIGHFGKYHNILCLSPQILHKHCFQFLLGHTMVPRENKNNAYANFGGKNKEYYGNFRSGLLYATGWMRGVNRSVDRRIW